MRKEYVLEQVTYWANVLLMLDDEIKEGESRDTKIYKKYLELENVSDVAKWMNEQGYREPSIATERMVRLDSNDIKAALLDLDADVLPELSVLVRKIFLRNKRKLR